MNWIDVKQNCDFPVGELILVHFKEGGYELTQMDSHGQFELDDCGAGCCTREVTKLGLVNEITHWMQIVEIN